MMVFIVAVNVAVNFLMMMKIHVMDMMRNVIFAGHIIRRTRNNGLHGKSQSRRFGAGRNSKQLYM